MKAGSEIKMMIRMMIRTGNRERLILNPNLQCVIITSLVVLFEIY